jgi:chondroitin AC lyase
MSSVLIFLATSVIAVATAADDVAIVRERMLQLYAFPSLVSSPNLTSTAASALALAARLLPNGTWADVNYNDFNDRAIWATSTHTARVQFMSSILAFKASPVYNDAGLFNSTRLALNAWLKNDWRNANWWFTILQTPQTIALSVLLLDTLPPAETREPFPSQAELDAALAIVFRAAWWNSSLGYIVTGANLAWLVQAQLLRGVWPSLVNMTALTQGFARMFDEIKVVPWDSGCAINGPCNGTNQGIQVDGSWHFHGSALYTSQYGQDYLNDELAFIQIADGSAFAYQGKTASVICDYIVGCAWTSTGLGFDWVSAGRALDRNTWSSVSKITLNASQVASFAPLCAADSAAIVRAFAAGFDNATAKTAPAAIPSPGYRHFWTSDYAVFKRKGWSASWKGLSNRTLPNECGNGENLLGMYESQGVINIVEEGDGRCTEEILTPQAVSGPIGWGCGQEYALVFPLLDWRAINGVTALWDLPVPPCGLKPQCCWYSDLLKSRRSFVGSASDGVFGVTAMDTQYLSLSGKKATLFFDMAVISLGANISESSGASSVRTAIASRFLRADKLRTGVTLGFANGSMSWFSANSSESAVHYSGSALRWAYADNIGWLNVFDDGAFLDAALDAAPRVGNWSSIGPWPGQIHGNTITLTIGQGGGGGEPLAGAAFAYAIVPNVSTTIMSAAAAPGGLRATHGVGEIVNTAALQAGAQFDSDGNTAVIEAVFWEPSTYSAGSLQIAVDAPCILTYRVTNFSTAVVAVSVPDRFDAVVNVFVGASCPAITFSLNAANQVDYIGRSKVATLSCTPCCTIVG